MVGVIKEREQLVIMVDIEIEADVKDSSKRFPGRNTLDSYLWLTQNGFLLNFQKLSFQALSSSVYLKYVLFGAHQYKNLIKSSTFFQS